MPLSVEKPVLETQEPDSLCYQAPFVNPLESTHFKVVALIPNLS
jgi:hypothetical protein